MAGEYGIERQVILPEIPPGLQEERLVDYLQNQRRMLTDAYDELAQRTNELSYEAHWGSNSPTQVVANQNDYNLGTAIVHRFTTDASRTFTGFEAPLTEMTHVIVNAGSFNAVIAHQSASSVAANRVITISAANVTLAPNDSLVIWYDLATGRWRELHRQLAAAMGTGTVTSVALTMPTGFSVAGSPITTSGTLAVTTTLDGILKANGSAIGVIIVGTGLNYDGTTLIATGTGSGSGSPPIFRPFMNEPPATGFATLDTRNAHPVLDFDGATDEEAVFSAILPSSYAGGGLTVSTWWSFTSATSGSLRVQAAIERINTSGLDIDADSFASFQSAGGTAPGTSGQIIKVDVVFTDGAQMDSLAAGEVFRLKIRRDADGTSGTDDITTDAELVMAMVMET